MGRPKLVHVRWFDASYQNAECHADDFTTRVELETVGFLARQDADTVSVAMEYYERDETWRHVSHIPRCNVIKLRYLKV